MSEAPFSSVPPAKMPLIWRRAGLVCALVQAIILSWLMLTPLSAPPVDVPSADKVFNALAFAALVFPLIVTDPRRWVWAVPLCIGFGGAIELIQPYVGRGAEWLDFGADMTGVLAGAALAEALHARFVAWVTARDAVAVADPTPGAEAEARAQDRHASLERMRVELREDLRTVLREEMATLAQRDAALDPSTLDERPDQPRHPRH